MLALSDKYLHTGGKEVDTKEDNLPAIYELCVEMQELMNELGGIGLSACQVGKPYQVFVTAQHEGFYLNCQYLSQNPQVRNITEGCLSLPGKQYRVSRYTSIWLDKGSLRLTKDGDKFILHDLYRTIIRYPDSIVWQHEIDHHNGITIDRKGREIKASPTKIKV